MATNMRLGYRPLSLSSSMHTCNGRSPNMQYSTRVRAHLAFCTYVHMSACLYIHHSHLSPVPEGHPQNLHPSVNCSIHLQQGINLHSLQEEYVQWVHWKTAIRTYLQQWHSIVLLTGIYSTIRTYINSVGKATFSFASTRFIAQSVYRCGFHICNFAPSL